MESPPPNIMKLWHNNISRNNKKSILQMYYGGTETPDGYSS